MRRVEPRTAQHTRIFVPLAPTNGMADQSVTFTEVASVHDDGVYANPDDRSSSGGGANACSSADRSKEPQPRTPRSTREDKAAKREQELAKKKEAGPS